MQGVWASDTINFIPAPRRAPRVAAEVQPRRTLIIDGGNEWSCITDDDNEGCCSFFTRRKKPIKLKQFTIKRAPNPPPPTPKVVKQQIKPRVSGCMAGEIIEGPSHISGVMLAIFYILAYIRCLASFLLGRRN